MTSDPRHSSIEKPMRSYGGNQWTFAFWRQRSGWNWYLRLGSRSIFWRQP